MMLSEPGRSMFDIDEDAMYDLNIPRVSDLQNQQFISQVVALKENIMRDMLRQWVSEIEPVAYYNQAGELMGLGWAGAGPIILVPNITLDYTSGGHVLYRRHISGVRWL